MRFVGRVAIILIVVFAAAAAHSMAWPITRDTADAMARSRARASTGQATTTTTTKPLTPSPTSVDQSGVVTPKGGEQAIDPPPGDPPKVVDELPKAEWPEHYITVERAFQYWEEGMPFVDARTDAERVVGTIEGALHLETRHFITGASDAVMAQMDRAFPVVVFCAGGECDASENVAQRLIGRGYTEVYIMHEGFGAWEAAGHPTEQVGAAK